MAENPHPLKPSKQVPNLFSTQPNPTNKRTNCEDFFLMFPPTTSVSSHVM
ncbi:hypothetical protein BofuT4_uP123730.1 [Botrytis cinerea T4]|uniref:Uncharacterized protein n=1 Tax=Botryotinia fuckeliana (strain T4) TaxID=999810 RepID=G2YP06_BOTF4|nr:hypothetical protein BofuT4_uP123730.1 [Botrytis cinerea T4]